MNRSCAYHTNIALKLISSKFTSYQANNQIPIKQITIKTKMRGQEIEANVIAFTILFNRKPAFNKLRRIAEGGYILQNLYLTARKHYAAHCLDIFSTIILPFQLENQSIKAKPALHQEFSWQAPHCLPPTLLNPIFFYYPVTNNELDLVVSILPDKHILQSLFYLNILRIPVDIN